MGKDRPVFPPEQVLAKTAETNGTQPQLDSFEQTQPKNIQLLLQQIRSQAPPKSTIFDGKRGIGSHW